MDQIPALWLNISLIIDGVPDSGWEIHANINWEHKALLQLHVIHAVDGIDTYLHANLVGYLHPLQRPLVGVVQFDDTVIQAIFAPELEYFAVPSPKTPSFDM